MKRNSISVTNLRVPGTTRFSYFGDADHSLPDQRLSLTQLSRTLTHPFTSPATQEYDVLYENQRGFYFLGIPKFSANLLNPLDPPAWCDRFGKGVSTDIQTYSLPDPTWEWVDNNWLVDMSGDVDPNGWQYAFRFCQHTWRGDPKVFQNFVRRRRWIRLRQKKQNIERTIGTYGAASQYLEPRPVTPSSLKSTSGSTSVEPLSTEQEPSELVQLLISSRVDREKLAIIQQEILQRKAPFNEQEIEEILTCIEYDLSRKRLRELLLRHNAVWGTLPDCSARDTGLPSSNFSTCSSQTGLRNSRCKDSTTGTRGSFCSDAKPFLG